MDGEETLIIKFLITLFKNHLREEKLFRKRKLVFPILDTLEEEEEEKEKARPTYKGKAFIESPTEGLSPL